MAYSARITIGGTNVTADLLSFEVVDTVTDITIANMLFDTSVFANLDIESEQEVIITEGTTTSTDYTIFRGNVSNITKVSGANTRVEAKDKLWTLQKIIVTRTYDKNIDSEAGVVSAIANDLITSDGGLTASVENTGTTLCLDKYVLRSTTVLDAINELAEIVNYWVYYDAADDTVYFRSRGFTTFGTTFSVGINLAEVPEWERDFSRIANDVSLEGDLQELETTETDTGDGITTQYTLSFKPESVKVFVNNVLQTGGVAGQTATFDYSVDKENRQINFETAPGNTLAIEFRYSYLSPVRVRYKNPSSIAKYGVHAIHRKIDTIQTTDDAINKAGEITAKFSDPIIHTTLKTYDVYNMKAAQKIQVTDSINNENQEVIIRQVTHNYPINIKELIVDNEPIYQDVIYEKEIRRRIERLERKTLSSEDLINQTIGLNRSVKFRRRYLNVQRSKIADSFILGHPVNGLLGQGQILDGMDSSSGNWSSSSGITESDDATTTIVGAGSLSVQFTSTGSQTLTTTQSFGDVSTETGQSSGTPSQGTVGIWWNSPNTTGITAITLRIGSSASDYIECTGRSSFSVEGYVNWSGLAFELRSGWNYYVFDLDNPSSTTGTPDWTACDYARIEFTVSGTHTGYLDYFTISQSNLIGMNGLGDRNQTVDSDMVLLQGQMIYREYVYDEDFLDSTNSTATFTTGTNTISFTSGQVWRSLAVETGTTITSARIDLGAVVGTLLLEVSADNGTNWQTLTEGTLTSLTNPGSTGFLIRITENAATTASITNTTDTYGVVTEPAIKLTMVE